LVKRAFAKIKRFANNIRGNGVSDLENKKGMIYLPLSCVSILLIILNVSNLASFAAQLVDEIVASVNSKIITKGELEKNVYIFKVFGVGRGSAESYHELEKVVLYHMIDNYLLQQEAKKQGLTVSDAELQKALKTLQGDVPENEFVQNLRKENITLEELKEKLKREILREKVTKWKAREWREEIQVSDKEAENFFISLKRYIEENGKKGEDILQFYRLYHHEILEGEKVLLAQIIVESKEKAENVVRKLQQGEDFSSLAKKYSLGPGADEGGELGWFSLTQIQSPLRSIIGRLKKGEVTKALEVGDKFYRILQVKDRKKLHYEEWKEKIEDFLFRKKMVEHLDEWLKSLREENFIQIMQEDLREGWKS